ncbi:gelsolin-related protein of 125 kDa-like isoform X2 [Eriocheir sinensis]|uniref:gelsolin-related protein of 125 kDa-like isoform X2 n=1 Tax=Eriocheir sinensis TaxID=95602 RepID=UPI0021C8ADD7|nr:gelsolin-related protein of 125 kDa-like isoform X2 [Eriocheir sinensis]
MSALRPVTLVLVVGATCCLGFQDLTENPETPQYLVVLDHFAENIKKVIEDKLAPIENKLTEALQKTEALEGKLLQKIEDLKLSTDGKIEDLKLNTDGKIDNLQNDITTEIRDESNRVADKVFTKDEMAEVVREEAVELKERCTNAQRLTALQNNVLEVKEMLEEVKKENVEMKNVGQNVSEEVRGVKDFVEVMAQEVQGLAMTSKNFSSTLEDVSYSVHLLTATPPPPPPQEEEEEEEEQATGPVYPCLDSTFPSGADICAVAVKFKKCHLLLPSYHCCHTCTTNGQLPEMGSWRHQNLNRDITGTQLIHFFSI